MENKDTNTDYQKVVRVGGQKREFVEITFRMVFLRFFFIIFYTGSFEVSPEKNHPPPKVPIPNQNPNLTKFPPIQT